MSLALVDSAMHIYIQQGCTGQHIRILLVIINEKLNLIQTFHSFIHLFDRFLLGMFYVSGTVLDAEDRAVNLAVSTHTELAF